jgi:hypothetical protein
LIQKCLNIKIKIHLFEVAGVPDARRVFVFDILLKMVSTLC